MKPGLGKRIFPLIVLFCPAAALSAPIPPVTGPSQSIKIRVRVAEALPGIAVRGFDLRFYRDLKLAYSASKKSEWEIRCQDGRIHAAAKGSSGLGKKLDVPEPLTIESPTGFLKMDGKAFRDELQIYSRGGSCEVVNNLDIERYLDGVVNSEFNSKWGEEATAAQVIAARTFAYHRIRQARFQLKRTRFDVDGSVRDQVYEGSDHEDLRASQAVERTRGMILTVGSGKKPQPLTAFYHSTCGGRTELPENVWGAKVPGFKHSVACPFCLNSPRMKWELKLSGKEIASVFLQGAKTLRSKPAWLKRWPGNWQAILSRGTLMDFRVAKSDGGNRVTEIRGEWSLAGRIYDLSLPGTAFRDWLGPARLRSTSFQLTASDEESTPTWRIDGRGNGHGVGMCQWGAKVMGERGFKAAAILKYYYPDANLRKLW